MLTIAASANVERLRERLDHGLRELERQGVRVVRREQIRGPYTFVSVAVQAAPARPEAGWGWQDMLRRQLAAVLCEVIISDFRQFLLERIVTSRYPQLGVRERQTVVEYAERSLADAAARDAFRRRVLVRLLEYLRDNRQLILEGFITFRLKEYVEHLEEAVERAIDEILLEKEYQEFVRLLQCFVAAQEPRLPEVHVICRASGLVLEDGERHTLSLQVPPSLQGGIRPEDLVVSGLVSLAPARVVVHGSPATTDDRAVVDAVRSIFAGRTTTCPGCPRCCP
ncbi:MAG: putative sporulation protein YtxC [Bacillota bacterium]|nr:putative sporulation protein YtxC [Bacillota bacterium]